jgi:hypothetical protein
MFFLALILLGCGGHQDLRKTNSGTLAISIHWPARSRVIPEAANSIRIRIFAATDTVAEQVLGRPASGPLQTTATFANLPTAAVLIEAKAYPSEDGTGTVQASGATSIQLVAGSTVSTSIALGSSIDHVDVTPAISSLDLHASADFMATAFDGDGNVVLTASDAWVWSASNATLSLVPAGATCHVTGANAGSGSLTAKESESGEQKSLNLTVGNTGIPARYTITPVCQLGTDSRGLGINDLGQVVGYFSTPGGHRPFVNRGAGAEELPNANFVNYRLGEANAINNSGKIVGTVYDDNVFANSVAVWYVDGTHRHVANAGQSFGLGVNASGQIVGSYRASDSDFYSPAIWDTDDASVRVFGYTTGGLGISIADNGSVAYSLHHGGSDWQAFFNDGQDHALGNDGSGGAMQVMGLSGDKVVGGMGTSIALWTGASFASLGVGSATGINVHGVIVGYVSGPSGFRSFAYTPQSGMVDLLDHVANPAGWTEISPNGINANGQIVGSGSFNGEARAFVLTPN